MLAVDLEGRGYVSVYLRILLMFALLRDSPCRGVFACFRLITKHFHATGYLRTIL
jgi:hypothetical protein